MRKLKNEELGRLSIEEFQKAEKHPITVVLDDVRSMHNVGSVFRTCDAFRIEKMILTGITPTPPHRDINKVALGASDTVPWEYQENQINAISELKRDGYTILSVEQADNSLPLNEFKPAPDKRYAIIFGHEVYGVKDEIINISDHVLEIPQYGTKHSLNISVCAGIVLWHLTGFRQDLNH